MIMSNSDTNKPVSPEEERAKKEREIFRERQRRIRENIKQKNIK